MFNSRFVRTVVASCAALSFTVSATAVTAGASPRSTSHFKVLAPAMVAPHGSHALGALSAHSTMHFTVYLNSRNAAGLERYAAAVTNVHSPLYGHYLTRGAFAHRFGASKYSVSNVRAFLRVYGLHVIGGVRDGLALRIMGHVGAINRAFATRITRYQLASGAIGTAASMGIRIPSALSTSVLSVIGLNNLTHLTTSTKITRPHTKKLLSHLRWPAANHIGRSFSTHPRFITGAPAACAGAITATHQGSGGITHDQVATAYGVNGLYGAGDFGAGQTVAIYELEPFAMSDVAAFDQCYFGTDNSSNVSVVNVDGGPGTGSGSGESALDIQNVSALAPSAHIVVYQAPNSTAGALDAYGQIVADDTAKIVTTSWGLCEAAAVAYSPGSLAVEHVLFEQAAAQGQSVFAAAGDSGSNDCAGHGGNPVAPYLSVDDPAAQPYVVSVGGTTAITVTNPPVEQVWNDGSQGGAGGGGPSSLWTMPSWQTNVPAVAAAAPSTLCGGSGTLQCRVTPDVSAFADEFTGITISLAGGWYTIGGTSSSAPIWASLLAEVNASSSCAANSATANGVGFVSPLLYEVGNNPTLAAQGFNDITTGNNDSFSYSHGSYTAGVGYDAASGLGTPNLTGPGGTGLAASLCNAANESTTSKLTSVYPPLGSRLGNTRVQINGTGFMTGSVSNVKGVDFGQFPAASFTVMSPTVIVARTAPAQVPHGSGAPLNSGTESLVSVTFNSGHVAVGPTFSYLAVASRHKIPTVLSVGPNGGPTAGGNQVKIYGTGLTLATAVTFGGVPATSYLVVSDSMILAVAPPKSTTTCFAGSFSVTSGLCQTTVIVTTPLGSSQSVTPLKPLQGYFSYNNLGVPIAPSGCNCELYPTVTEYDYQAAATITSVTPSFTSTAAPLLSPYGGDSVVIRGTGFNYLTLNYALQGDGLDQFQIAQYENVTFHSFVLYIGGDANPSPTGNTENIYVNTMGGTSAPATLIFGPAPKITGVSVNDLPSAGGLSMTITGLGLSAVRYVAFSSPFGLPSTNVLRNFHVDSATQITLLSPSLTPGSYQVSVGNIYADSSIYTDVALDVTNVIVTYPGGPEITGATGNSCSSAGGCTITLTGKNLGTTPGMTLYIGAEIAPITSVTVAGGIYTVTATVPASFMNGVGSYLILLQTDNGSTPYTLLALETYF